MTEPASELTRFVCESVAELLELDAAKPSDNFVELGGNSLLAVVLANMIEDRSGIRPDLLDIFNLDLSTLAMQIASQGR